MPPPSSGGVHLIQILNILEGFDLGRLGAGSADAIHIMAEAMKPAYADRAAWLGDPDEVKIPFAGCSRRLTRRGCAPPSTPPGPIRPPRSPGDPLPFEADQTTHVSVVDAQGNAVANTTTLNFSYGLGLVAEGTGVMLNNEMDDFSAKPGARNAYGLVGGDRTPSRPARGPCPR